MCTTPKTSPTMCSSGCSGPWGTYSPGNFEGWLHRITTNVFLDKMRRKQRIRFDALSDESSARLPSREPSPDQVYADRHFDDDVQRALDTLPPDFRAAVVLCDIEGLSYEEIAATLGVKLGTVRSRIHRGRAQLREALAHRARKSGGPRRPAPPWVVPASRRQGRDDGGVAGGHPMNRSRCLGDLVGDYVEAALPQSEQLSWDRHLVACTSCRGAADLERRVRATLRSGPAVSDELRAMLLAVSQEIPVAVPARRSAASAAADVAPSRARSGGFDTAVPLAWLPDSDDEAASASAAHIFGPPVPRRAPAGLGQDRLGPDRLGRIVSGRTVSGRTSGWRCCRRRHPPSIGRRCARALFATAAAGASVAAVWGMSVAPAASTSARVGSFDHLARPAVPGCFRSARRRRRPHANSAPATVLT
jgi:RNA polymerase sigma factor (sigma-70 family)